MIKRLLILLMLGTNVVCGQYLLLEHFTVSGFASDEFVTKWSVPSGSFTFPAASTGTYSGEIDFGDGGGWKTFTAYNDANLTNNYASAGDYTIRVRGTFPHFYINNGSVRLYLTEVVQWGDVGFENFSNSFYGAANLGTLPSGTITGASSVTSATNIFLNCIGLVVISSDLFSLMTALTNLSGGFNGCINLTVLVSLTNNTAITLLVATWNNCGSLNLEIPSDYLSTLTALTNLNSTWRGCVNIYGDVPNVSNNTLVTTFRRTWRDCNLNGTIPSFSNNTAVIDFSQTFYNNNLTGSSQSLWLEGNNTLSPPDYDSGTPNGGDCYFGNTGLSDYATIPTYWK